MSPRQEAEGAVVAGHQIFRQDDPEPHDVGDNVSVRQHHALGLPCGARRVYHSRQLFGVREVGGDPFACDAQTRWMVGAKEEERRAASENAG